MSLETVPILARGHAGALAKGSREIRLRRKVQCDSNIEQGLIPSYQKLFCALETLRADAPRYIRLRGWAERVSIPNVGNPRISMRHSRIRPRFDSSIH